MADRDAFGNELPRGEPAASAESAPVAAGSAFEEAAVVRTPGASTSVAPRVLGGCISFVAIVFVVGGCAIAGLVGSIGDGVDTFRSISTEFSRATSVPSPPGPAAPAEPTKASPRGLQAGSLVRRAAFARAVRELRGAGLGRPRLLRLAPDRLDAQLVTGGGQLRSVQLAAGGSLRTLSTSPGGFPKGDLVTLATIDRGAPERLVRAAARRAGRSATRVDYLVLTQFDGAPRWLVFFVDGPAYQADRKGRIERVVR